MACIPAGVGPLGTVLTSLFLPSNRPKRLIFVFPTKVAISQPLFTRTSWDFGNLVHIIHFWVGKAHGGSLILRAMLTCTYDRVSQNALKFFYQRHGFCICALG